VSYWMPREYCSDDVSKMGLVINNWCAPDELLPANPYFLKAYEYDDCVAKIEVKTKYGCPTKHSGLQDAGLSLGSVILITLTVIVFVYAVGGMAFQYRFREARGIEMIPNLVFWQAIPGLVKDGCMYTWVKIQNLRQRVVQGHDYSTL